jgi:nitrogen-specific signal transduction histidine kinase
MGLGLAISKSILENYKGTISYQSIHNETVFTLEVPLKEQER